MPYKRNKELGKKAYFSNDISVSADKSAWIHKIPTSSSWYFRMWIKEENRQFRKSLRTQDQDEATRLGIEEHANVIGMTKSGKKLFGMFFSNAAEEWLEVQKGRTETGLITKQRLSTVKTQIKRHIIPYIEQYKVKNDVKNSQNWGKNVRVGSLKFNDFFDYAQYRRKKNPEVEDVTIRNEHTTIGSLIKWCFRTNMTTFEQCQFEEIRIKEVKRRDTFTIEEWEVLYKFLRKWRKESPDYRTANNNMMPSKKKDFMRDMILLNGNNLMRIGEIRQLKWGMVKNIKRGKYFYTQYDLPAAITKTRTARQFVARGGEYLNRIKTYSNYLEKDDFVFCDNQTGKQLNKTEVYKMWWDIRDKVDIDKYKPTGEERKLTLYSLRHFAITCRLMAGVNHYEIAKDSGTSVTQIEKHYEHMDMTKLINNLSKDFRIGKDGGVERYERKG